MDKTLIIVGAGASKDFCYIFPTGLELIKEINYHFLTEKKFPIVDISEGVYLSALMNDVVRVFGNKENLFKKIKNQLWALQLDYEYKTLRNNLTWSVSIDHFIAEALETGKLESEAVDIIKYAIYYLIKGTEQAYSERQVKNNNNWIAELAKKIQIYSIDDILVNFKIITFNYDRLIEKYLVEYLYAFLNLTQNQISKLRESIFHVYSSLGDISEVHFGLSNERFEIINNYFRKINLIDERDDREIPLENPDQYKAVHFVGFGFDEDNLNKLNLKRFKTATLSGTVYNLLDNQLKELNEKFIIRAVKCTCLDYMQKINL